MRQAGHAAAKILGLVATQVRAGISTAEVDRLAADLIRENGCTSAFLGYRNYPANICVSLNDEVVHGIGKSSRIIRDGDIVKLDVGVYLNGWVGDNATTVPVGDIIGRIKGEVNYGNGRTASDPALAMKFWIPVHAK